MGLRLFLHPMSGTRASRKISQPSFATDPGFRHPAHLLHLLHVVEQHPAVY